jgi:hypothetical protein
MRSGRTDSGPADRTVRVQLAVNDVMVSRRARILIKSNRTRPGQINDGWDAKYHSAEARRVRYRPHLRPQPPRLRPLTTVPSHPIVPS